MASTLAGGHWQAQYHTGLSCDPSCLTSLPTATEATLIKFADGIKGRAPVNMVESRAASQGDLHKKGTNGQTGTLSNSTTANAKSCARKGIILCSDTHWALPG